MSDAEPFGEGEEPGAGVSIDDLPKLMRELFLQCVADAQATVDPRSDFDAFIEEFWKQTSAAFSLTGSPGVAGGRSSAVASAPRGATWVGRGRARRTHQAGRPTD